MSLELTAWQAPKWSFTSRKGERKHEVPGPGSYELSRAENAAKRLGGGSVRFRPRTFARSPKFSFGSAGRNLVSEKRTSVGPGLLGRSGNARVQQGMRGTSPPLGTEWPESFTD